jgi:hypothetical protein
VTTPNLLITGMARSGTSLTTRVFVRKGYYVGDVHMPAGLINPLGFFEPEAIVSLNVELLEEAGFPHHNTWRYETVSAAVVEKMARLPIRDAHRRLLDHYNAHAPWVWKDIRFSYTLPFWLRFLDVSTLRILVVRRRLSGILHSIERMDAQDGHKTDFAAMQARIDDHIITLCSILKSHGIAHLEVEYDDYFDHPAELAARMAAFTGIELSEGDLGVVPSLNHDRLLDRLLTVVRAQLNRSSLAPVRLALKRVVPPSVQAVLVPEREILEKFRQGPPQASG